MVLNFPRYVIFQREIHGVLTNKIEYYNPEIGGVYAIYNQLHNYVNPHKGWFDQNGMRILWI